MEQNLHIHLIGDERGGECEDLVDLLCGGDARLVLDGVLHQEDGHGAPALEVELQEDSSFIRRFDNFV